MRNPCNFRVIKWLRPRGMSLLVLALVIGKRFVLANDKAFNIGTANIKQLSWYHWEDVIWMQINQKLVIYFKLNKMWLRKQFVGKPSGAAKKQCGCISWGVLSTWCFHLAMFTILWVSWVPEQVKRELGQCSVCSQKTHLLKRHMNYTTQCKLFQ